MIFDEIQNCPEALTSLKYFSEDLPGMFVCAAGSLLGVSLSGTSFPVGKVCYLDLYPLNFEEFLMNMGDDILFKEFQESLSSGQVSSLNIQARPKLSISGRCSRTYPSNWRRT